MKHYGPEFLEDDRLGLFKKAYIRIFGIPISGLRIRLRRILPRLEEVAGDIREVADLGCGKGVFTFELGRRFPKAHVVGYDIDEAQILANQEIVKKLGLERVRFEKADILSLQAKNRFDLVLSVDNLEHIQDDEVLLKIIFGSLRPGGAFVCHVPALERIWVFSGVKTNFDVAGHVRPGYRLTDLEAKLKNAGFQIQTIEPTYGYLETVSNNLSYLITKAEQKNVLAYALAFPFLNAMAWMGKGQKPGQKGAGVFAIAVRPKA